MEDNLELDNVNDDFLKLALVTDGIQLSYINQMHAVADKDVYYQQHFQAVIPKKIKTWIVTSPVVQIEYDDAQVVIIDPGYKSQLQIYPWTIIEDDTKLRNYVYNFYRRKNKNWDYDQDFANDRIYKHYVDGKTNIILFNVKKKNAQKFENVIKSFTYID